MTFEIARLSTYRSTLLRGASPSVECSMREWHARPKAAVSRHLVGTYVAKREVGTWPLFGSIAKITGTILVERTAARARALGEEIRRQVAAARRGAGCQTTSTSPVSASSRASVPANM